MPMGVAAMCRPGPRGERRRLPDALFSPDAWGCCCADAILPNRGCRGRAQHTCSQAGGGDIALLSISRAMRQLRVEATGPGLETETGERQFGEVTEHDGGIDGGD
ncbi:hypothetical protein GCM10011587_29470 [Pyruvatibacter mobilis]|nr:hypothetical protein GCM10011587_29470 [Pyruvatibacter mobilis]